MILVLGINSFLEKAVWIYQ